MPVLGPLERSARQEERLAPSAQRALLCTPSHVPPTIRQVV